MLDAIPNQHYEQFLNDISYRLLQKVCSLASLFASTEPVHIFQKIGIVILDYLRDLRSNWFGGANQLARAFQKWHLLVEQSPLFATPDAASAAASASAPQTSTQLEHQKRVDLVMKTPAKRESKAEHQKQIRDVEEGRKQIRDWQLQRRHRRQPKDSQRKLRQVKRRQLAPLLCRVWCRNLVIQVNQCASKFQNCGLKKNRLTTSLISH